MKNSNKKSMTQLMLNEMKNASYTKKEGIYAQLIIKVLEEANQFDETLDNVYVDHNVIEMLLICGSVSGYLHDTFGRSEEEFSPEFIAACKELKSKFNLDYPHAKIFVNGKRFYFTPMCFGVKIFMRKVISRIVFPLGIKAKAQPIFVSLNIFKEGSLDISWYSGKKYGNYFLGEDYEISRGLNKSEMRLLENQINEAVMLNEYEVLDFDDLANIIDSFIDKETPNVLQIN